ncbi:MAG: DUF58 domain-containing protein [Bacteroidota bacterium]
MLTPERIAQIGSLEWRAKEIVEGFISGKHKSPFYGYSVEFADHRPYHPGDELKYIDWNAYAKTERYYVKRFEAETNMRSYVMLDISPSMRYKYYGIWDKMTYGGHLAASLLYLMHKQRDAFTLIPFDREVEEWYPVKSTYPHLKFLLDYLTELTESENNIKPGTRKRSAQAQAIHEVASRLKHRSLVVLITDLLMDPEQGDEFLSSLRHLRHQRHEVVVFQLLEQRSEVELDLPDHRYELQDLETGEQMELRPSQVREAYREEAHKYFKEFKTACRESNIDFETIDTQSPLDHALLAYLNRRGRQ